MRFSVINISTFFCFAHTITFRYSWTEMADNFASTFTVMPSVTKALEYFAIIVIKNDTLSRHELHIFKIEYHILYTVLGKCPILNFIRENFTTVDNFSIHHFF